MREGGRPPSAQGLCCVRLTPVRQAAKPSAEAPVETGTRKTAAAAAEGDPWLVNANIPYVGALLLLLLLLLLGLGMRNPPPPLGDGRRTQGHAKRK
jgi:hypothetical protein